MDTKVWRKLIEDVLAFHGDRCCRCRSEEDLLIYQFKWTEDEDHWTYWQERRSQPQERAEQVGMKHG